MTTDAFKETFSVLALEMRHFLESEIRVNIPSAKIIYKILKKKSDTRSKPLQKSMFVRSPDSVLREIRAEHV